jgi:hypothetical protein
MADDKAPSKSDDKAPDKKEATQAATKTAEEKASAEGAVDPDTSRLGKFILKYHTFLSSFVIGAVGLLATSIWQYRQSQTTRWQAEAQQKVAETQAANSWKIERAEILAKNLQVLASTGAATVDQRYGVLLSLARGNILDPELSVSYALELGKDNPDYMQSVLANTSDKDYLRLSRAFVVSCEEKYGLTRNVEACAGDKMAPRSRAIGQLILDESEAAATQNQPGPLVMLKDERQVQQNVQRFAALFEPLLTDYYERRLWTDIAKFEAYSPGAHVVAALVLAAARTGEVALRHAPLFEQLLQRLSRSYRVIGITERVQLLLPFRGHPGHLFPGPGCYLCVSSMPITTTARTADQSSPPPWPGAGSSTGRNSSRYG